MRLVAIASAEGRFKKSVCRVEQIYFGDIPFGCFPKVRSPTIRQPRKVLIHLQLPLAIVVALAAYCDSVDRRR